MFNRLIGEEFEGRDGRAGKLISIPVVEVFSSMTVEAEKSTLVGIFKRCFALKSNSDCFFFLPFEIISCSLPKKIRKHRKTKRAVFALHQAHLSIQHRNSQSPRRNAAQCGCSGKGLAWGRNRLDSRFPAFAQFSGQADTEISNFPHFNTFLLFL